MAEKSSFQKDDREDLSQVRRAKAGDKKAFGRLVLKYQKRIYFTIRKMVLDHGDTNDIVQDTFVKAFLNLNRFDETFAFYPWLHRIAVNTAINHLNKQTRRKESFLVDGKEEFHDTFKSASNPVKEMEQKELKDHLYDALKHLPSEQRAVFVLRTSEELSYQEISQQLDISIGTVMSRLSRAREKLKTILDPFMDSSDC
jgi:RNA polymerase sigma-70 factor (ECF subfamily)